VAQKKSKIDKLLIVPKVIIILQHKNYMSMMKEELAEIKRVYRSLNLSPVGTGGC